MWPEHVPNGHFKASSNHKITKTPKHQASQPSLVFTIHIIKITFTIHKLPPKRRVQMELNSIRVTPQSDSKALTNVDTYSCKNNLGVQFSFSFLLASVKIAIILSLSV